MKAENKTYSSVVARFVAVFILLASLLILANSGCDISVKRDPVVFEKWPLKYTVWTEDKASLTGTVSVEAISKEISGDIEIPASVTNNWIYYSVNFIPAQAFFGCSNLTSITIPDSVPSIEIAAFAKCSSLESVTIGKSVTEIGYTAFAGCSNLTSITIPDSVTRIGGSAFSDCTSLKSIIIPGSVTSIGNFAFLKCDKLTAVYFKGNAPEYPGGFEFNYTATIYYKPGTTGWKKSFNDRPTKEWVE